MGGWVGQEEKKEKKRKRKRKVHFVKVDFCVPCITVSYHALNSWVVFIRR